MSAGETVDLSERSFERERMDGDRLDRTSLSAALEQVARVNFLLGGVRSLLRHLRPIAQGRTELSLLDVGVGNGRVSARVSRELGRVGVRVRWVGVDRHPDVVAVARRTLRGADREPFGPVGLVRADALRLPFADDSFDVATSTLTLHHLSDTECRLALGEMARVGRTAVLVSDLERSRLHHLGARVLSATVWRGDPFTRHDAPLSVRRAFTVPELERLAEEAPFRSAVVRRHFPFRLLLEGRP